MTRYFAYGANMCRSQMARRCPGAVPLGKAKLDSWRFVISSAGYASILPQSGSAVHGVLWLLTLRDLAALNAYESLDSGLYLRRILPVRHAGRQQLALVYVGRPSGPGRPRPGYHGIVLSAAREWQLPDGYLAMLQRLGPARLIGSSRPEVGEIR